MKNPLPNKKRIIWFILGGLVCIVLYLLGVGIYTRISSDPIIFIASLFLAVGIPIAECFVLKFLKRDLFDGFTLGVICLVYAMGILVLSVFGPTFIDRSISYHIAFYAAEEGAVQISDIEEAYSKEIFDKRIHDAVVAGFVTQNEDGSLSPTLKAKVFYAVMAPIGKITNSMDSYYSLKEMN